MHKSLVSYWAVIALFVIQGCHHVEDDVQNSWENIVTVLNENIRSCQKLAAKFSYETHLMTIDSSDNCKTFLYFVDDTDPIVLHHLPESLPIKYPCVSIAQEGDTFYWMLSDKFLRKSDGKRIRVDESYMIPTLQFTNNQWFCSVGNTSIAISGDQLSQGTPYVETADDDSVFIGFPSRFQVKIPIEGLRYLKSPNKAFYKDIFLDAGIGLTSRKSLYAAQYMKMSLEGVRLSRSGATQEEYVIQNNIFAGDKNDTNGRLLYPDGQPRYKVLFVNGGKATTHGGSLNEKSLQNMRLFVKKGGSYVGTCAGAFFASNGSNGNSSYPYLSIWPFMMNRTGISNSQTGMFVEKKSPLLDYYDFGGDFYVSNVRHNGGGYPSDVSEDTEVLARYDCPEKVNVHMQPCIWAYKSHEQSGRLVLEGSHPEEVSSGERRDLTAAMILYAMDGVGTVSIKGFLENGKMRMMDKKTEDNNPLFTKIGDLQCHHFAVIIPPNARNILLKVESDVDCDLALMMSRDTFAFPETADFCSSDGNPCQQLSFQTMEEGLWYISVQCLTTVTTTETEYGQEYTGRIDVLNGVPYQIKISWD